MLTPGYLVSINPFTCWSGSQTPPPHIHTHTPPQRCSQSVYHAGQKPSLTLDRWKPVDLTISSLFPKYEDRRPPSSGKPWTIYTLNIHEIFPAPVCFWGPKGAIFRGHLVSNSRSMKHLRFHYIQAVQEFLSLLWYFIIQLTLITQVF